MAHGCSFYRQMALDHSVSQTARVNGRQTSCSFVPHFHPHFLLFTRLSPVSAGQPRSSSNQGHSSTGKGNKRIHLSVKFGAQTWLTAQLNGTIHYVIEGVAFISNEENDPTKKKEEQVVIGQ